MNSTNLINYMENIRYERKISQEEFIFDVVSTRQYFRYRNGDSEAPFEIIVKFANKLEIPFLRLIYQYVEDKKKDKKLVQEYFNLVVSKKHKEANELFNRINEKHLIDEDSRTLAKVGKALDEFNRGSLSTIEFCSLMREFIKYKKLIKKESLHDFEVYLLGLLMEYSESDREEILTKLTLLFKNDKIITGGNVVFNLQTLFWIIKNLGREKNYSKLIEMSEYAIKYAKKGFSRYELEYFHYYKALAHLRTGDNINFEQELYSAIIINLYNSDDKKIKFFNTIRKDTGLSPEEFLFLKMETEK